MQISYLHAYSIFSCTIRCLVLPPRPSTFWSRFPLRRKRFFNPFFEALCVYIPNAEARVKLSTNSCAFAICFWTLIWSTSRSSDCEKVLLLSFCVYAFPSFLPLFPKEWMINISVIIKSVIIASFIICVGFSCTDLSKIGQDYLGKPNPGFHNWISAISSSIISSIVLVNQWAMNSNQAFRRNA